MLEQPSLIVRYRCFGTTCRSSLRRLPPNFSFYLPIYFA